MEKAEDQSKEDPPKEEKPKRGAPKPAGKTFNTPAHERNK